MEGKISSAELHPKTVKDIEKFGPEEIHRRRSVFAMVAQRNGSPLALGLREEAELISKIYGIT